MKESLGFGHPVGAERGAGGGVRPIHLLPRSRSGRNNPSSPVTCIWSKYLLFWSSASLRVLGPLFSPAGCLRSGLSSQPSLGLTTKAAAAASTATVAAETAAGVEIRGVPGRP